MQKGKGLNTDSNAHPTKGAPASDDSRKWVQWEIEAAGEIVSNTTVSLYLGNLSEIEIETISIGISIGGLPGYVPGKSPSVSSSYSLSSGSLPLEITYSGLSMWQQTLVISGAVSPVSVWCFTNGFLVTDGNGHLRQFAFFMV